MAGLRTEEDDGDLAIDLLDFAMLGPKMELAPLSIGKLTPTTHLAATNFAATPFSIARLV